MAKQVRARPKQPTEPAAAPGFGGPMWLAILLIIGGVAGLTAALALSIELVHKLENPDAVLACDIRPGLSCSGAMDSEYGRAFGFPNSFIGLAAFMAPIVVGVAVLAGARFARWFWTTFAIGMVLGLGFALWLAYHSIFVLGLICPWCFLVWIAMYAMVFPLLGWGFGTGALPSSTGFQAWAARWGGWSWVLSLAMLVTVTIAFLIANASVVRLWF